MPYCSKCGKEIVEGSSFCQNCGVKLSNNQRDIQSTPASLLVTDQQYKSFIGINSDEYLAKFNKFKIDGTDIFSPTWHWPAFFIPFLWMLYRKLYHWALLVFALSLIPFVHFILMIVFGVTGNYIYYKHSKKKILEINAEPSSSDVQRAVDIAQRGGVNKGIVIVVLILSIVSFGIAAAVAIPQFAAYRTKGYCDSAKEELKMAYVSSQAYFSAYPKGEINSVDDLKHFGYEKNDRIFVQVKGTADTLLISSQHPKCDKIYSIDSRRSIKEKIKSQ